MSGPAPLVVAGRAETLQLQTRRKNWIRNELRRERPPIARQTAIELILESHPDVTIRSSSAVYNCIGMVVASRRTTVEPCDLLSVLQDDEYRKIDVDSAAAGDVIVYRDNRGEVTHAGLILWRTVLTSNETDPFKVLSQWGMDGECEHDSLDVPDVYGRPTEYWTDRRMP